MAFGATREVRGDHPQLELGQLVVESQRDLLANALTDDGRANRVHIAFDDGEATELAPGLRAGLGRSQLGLGV